MHYSLLLLGLSSFVPSILADRADLGRAIPTVCNTEPSADPTPACYYAADPSGGMGLCPNLSNDGWCDCGSDGDYPTLDGSSPCAYTELPESTLALTSTSCVSSTTTVLQTLTVSPVPASSTTDAPVSTVPAQRRAEPTPTYTGVPDRRRASRLSKRQGNVAYSNCDDAPSDSWVAAKFETKRAVLQQAYSDAVALAKASENVAADNKGFTHYFGGTKADLQLTHFQQMMQAITSTTNYYNIQFECQNTPSCASDSIMVTDATVGGPNDLKVIEVCPKFWTADSTKYLLYDTKNTTPTPPYRANDATAKGWCRKSTANGDADVSARTNQYFSTAGHSILHELTHLDSLATQAGLTPDKKDKTHGTGDAPDLCELKGARTFLSRYVADDSNASPDYNAESYAAAATEIYFMDLCSFSQIRPVT